MSKLLPTLLLPALLLASACTPQEFEAIGRVLIESELLAPAVIMSPATEQPSATPSSPTTSTPAPALTPAPSTGSWSAAEREMYDLLMAYRAEKGLGTIPLSVSLTTVARAHVKDLLENPREDDSCNMHTWSDKGPWSAGCYTSDHALAKVMWDKPRELTTYKGNGYEIAFGGAGDGWVATPEKAIAGWKESSGHNSVMVNLGVWAKTKWQAVGVGINEKYAVIWFGEEPDTAR